MSNWVDITQNCKDYAASHLSSQNAMIHTESFSLMDSMSATELMDPKMDSCYQLEGSCNKEELLNPSNIPEGPISFDVLLKILKILFIFESAFLDGASVIESTHNCVYLWEGSWVHLESRIENFGEVNSLAEVALLRYCKSLHQSLFRVSHSILEADVYEDEDFQPQTSPMLSSVAVDEDAASKQLQACVSAIEASQNSHKDHKDKENGENGATSVLGTKKEVLLLLKTRLSLGKLYNSLDEFNCSALRKAAKAKRLDLRVQALQERHDMGEFEQTLEIEGEDASNESADKNKNKGGGAKATEWERAHVWKGYEEMKNSSADVQVRYAQMQDQAAEAGAAIDRLGKQVTQEDLADSVDDAKRQVEQKKAVSVPSGAQKQPDDLLPDIAYLQGGAMTYLKDPAVQFAISNTLAKIQLSTPTRHVFLPSYGNAVTYLQHLLNELLSVMGPQGVSDRLRTMANENRNRNRNKDTNDKSSSADVDTAGKDKEKDKEKGIGKDADINSSAVLTVDHLLTEGLRISSARSHLVTRSVYCTFVQALVSPSFQASELRDLVGPDEDGRDGVEGGEKEEETDGMAVYIANSMQQWGLPRILREGDLVCKSWVPGTLLKALGDTVKMLCVHRNKLLVKSDALLQSWGAVMADAQEVDANFRDALGIDASDKRQHWCTYWSITLLGQIMDVHLALMIESNLLSPPELDYFYWYWDHILSVRIHAHDLLSQLKYELQLQEFNTLQEERKLKLSQIIVERKRIKEGGKPGPEGTDTKLPSAPIEPPLPKLLPAASSPAVVEKTKGKYSPRSPYIAALEGQKELCRGLFRIAVALAKEHTPIHAVNTRKTYNKWVGWHWRFLQRFRSFQHLPDPQMLSYEAFVETVGTDGEDSNPDTHTDTTDTIDSTDTTPLSKNSKKNDKNKNKKEVEEINKLTAEVINAAMICFKNAKTSFEHTLSCVPCVASNQSNQSNQHVLTVADEYAKTEAKKLLSVSTALNDQATLLLLTVKSAIAIENRENRKDKEREDEQVIVEEKKKEKEKKYLKVDNELSQLFPVLSVS